MDRNTIKKAEEVAAKGVLDGHNRQTAAMLLVANELRLLREALTGEVQR
jgi:hypothetical protein